MWPPPPGLVAVQIRPFILGPIQISRHGYQSPTGLSFMVSPITITIPLKRERQRQRRRQPLLSYAPQSQPNRPPQPAPATQDDGIPIEDVKFIAKFKSRHNYIRVLEVSRKADHPFAGSRLLLLDAPGNIRSISFHFKLLTTTCFDVFATLPPVLPPGPIAILGLGAGSAARLILELYPEAVVHGWELDPSVIAVGREYFGLKKLEKQYPDRLFIHIGNALTASVKDGFAGIIVDLFSKGSLILELQDTKTWETLRSRLRKGGRIMVNVGGSCVEPEDRRRDGREVMEDTLRAIRQVFGDQVLVLSLGNGREDSSIALTGDLPDLEAWRKALRRSLQCYVNMWTPCCLQLGSSFVHGNLDIASRRSMPFRRLRSKTSLPPPAPRGNQRRTSYRTHSPRIP